MTFRVVYLNEESGELGRLPDLAVINAGGVLGPLFTVGGKGVLLDDGTSSSGTGVGLTLQTIYDSSPSATINVAPNKPFVLSNGSTDLFRVDTSTGTVAINGINILDFYNSFLNHNHTGTQVTVAGPFNVLSGTNVEEVFRSIDSIINGLGAAPIKTFRYDQQAPSQTWIIEHNKASTNASVHLYDANGEQIFADAITIVDTNIIQVSFNTEQTGSAIILLF